MKHKHLLEYSVLIEEQASVDDHYLIRGTALNADRPTRNAHIYPAEELEKSAHTLKGKPILKDHENKVESIAGRVRKSTYDRTSKSIKFEAVLNDPQMITMCQDGRLNTVSVGAYAEDLVKLDDGNYAAKGLRFAELSLVAVPADEGATFEHALRNAYKLKQALTEAERPETPKAEAPSKTRGEPLTRQEELDVWKLKLRKLATEAARKGRRVSRENYAELATLQREMARAAENVHRLSQPA